MNEERLKDIASGQWFGLDLPTPEEIVELARMVIDKEEEFLAAQKRVGELEWQVKQLRRQLRLDKE